MKIYINLTEKNKRIDGDSLLTNEFHSYSEI
jgi:hypothetical protein